MSETAARKTRARGRTIVAIAAIFATGLALAQIPGVLPPFLWGLGLAYLLKPVAAKARSIGLGPAAAAAAATALMLLVGVAAVAAIIPLAAEQAKAIAAAIPEDASGLRSLAERAMAGTADKLPPEITEKLKDLAASSIGTAAQAGGWLVRQILARSFAIMDIVSLVIISPIVAFHLIKDWGPMTDGVRRNVPPAWRPFLDEAAKEADERLAAFVRGQGSLCLVLVWIYWGTYAALGAQSPLLLGLLTGALAAIPYVGSLIGTVVVAAIVLLQTKEPTAPLLILAAAAVLQPIETYVLAPKFVGDKVGLHPVAALLALMAGGTLGGITGILVAIPVAAILAVVIRLAMAKWREGFEEPATNENAEKTT
jgi:predicted PurR-regulated permease PerM